MPIRLLLALTCAAAVLPAAAGELYKWTDEKGVVHYTDQPPPDKEFEQRELPKEPDSKPLQPQAAPGETVVTPRCEQARQNVETLENNDSVEMDTDGDGQVEKLDAAAHARELTRSREQVVKFCAAAASAPAAEPPADGG